MGELDPHDVACVEYDRDLGYFCYFDNDMNNQDVMGVGTEISRTSYVRLKDHYGIPTLDDYYMGKRKPIELRKKPNKSNKSEPNEIPTPHNTNGLNICSKCGESFTPNKFTPYQKKCPQCRNKR
jgi:hypothetical protein